MKQGAVNQLNNSSRRIPFFQNSLIHASITHLIYKLFPFTAQVSKLVSNISYLHVAVVVNNVFFALSDSVQEAGNKIHSPDDDGMSSRFIHLGTYNK